MKSWLLTVLFWFGYTAKPLVWEEDPPEVKLQRSRQRNLELAINLAKLQQRLERAEGLLREYEALLRAHHQKSYRPSHGPCRVCVPALNTVTVFARTESLLAEIAEANSQTSGDAQSP